MLLFLRECVSSKASMFLVPMLCGGVSSSPVLFIFWLIKLFYSDSFFSFFFPFSHFIAVLFYFSLFSVLKWLLFKFGREEK